MKKKMGTPMPIEVILNIHLLFIYWDITKSNNKAYVTCINIFLNMKAILIEQCVREDLNKWCDIPCYWPQTLF